MNVEIEAVRDFLAEVEPFSRADADTLSALARAVTVTYHPRGEVLLEQGQPGETLFIIRSGAVDVLDPEGVLLDRREAGRTVGYSSLFGDPEFRYRALTVEDSLLMALPGRLVLEVASELPAVERFFSSQTRRIAAEAEQLRRGPAEEFLHTPVRSLIQGPALSCAEATPIREAARLMTDHDVSSLLILGEGNRLCGILTDRDLRGRVLARGMSPERPVRNIMTADLHSISPETPAFEAMLLMAERHIHHLPVLDGDATLGLISSADVMRLLHQDPIYLTADLSQRSLEDLRGAYHDASRLALSFIERGSTPADVAQILTTVAGAIARRLLTLAEERLGPPPVPYAFIAVGSQGRSEMGLASDQDNALILDDAYRPEEHGPYFEALAEIVCRGLDDAGQVTCPGDMMASNPRWRMTLREWTRTFHTWMTAPTPDALLSTQVFFDLRFLGGSAHLAEELRADTAAHAQVSSRLHAHLAALAARREPPLGFFRGFVLDRSGEYAHTLDVKKGGLAAIVQLARLYALSSGVLAVDTRTRLAESASRGALSGDGARHLTDAFDVLGSLSLRHQAEQMRAGTRPDYHIDPAHLSAMDREHLRDAFHVIKKIQASLATAYPIRTI
ncbi:DUF294 nucleotidyltransferase-like domain-containing protein [Corynebacterium uropygiale]|uniref:DUF294 nucleotidyltransferase-like domain-containing protein n=1 Tax=Corynebacterium uropygiale TaxID=1775911 RepID=A0A9X1QPL2_9CORY|nr:DUF294 nucleotidyltransferase-like domain-containing protein [Corynebacterium uropygiale]MCF4007014.1 DUF294 nucleotidyltransferase-like domain-containing protein [Corynebacterium uropygiale]